MLISAVKGGKVTPGSMWAVREALGVLAQRHPAGCDELLAALACVPHEQPVLLPPGAVRDGMQPLGSARFRSVLEPEWAAALSCPEGGEGGGEDVLLSQGRVPIPQVRHLAYITQGASHSQAKRAAHWVQHPARAKPRRCLWTKATPPFTRHRSSRSLSSSPTQVLGVGGSSILRLLLDAAAPGTSFGCPTIQAVILHKWRAFGLRMMRTKVAVYAAFLALVLAFCMQVKSSDKQADLRQLVGSAPGAAAVAMAGCILLSVAGSVARVAASTCSGGLFVVWLRRSALNGLDLLSWLLCVVLATLFLLRVYTGVPEISAIVSLMMCTRFLFFARAFRQTGPLLSMVVAMWWEIRFFLVLLAIVIFSFGFSFFMLFAGEAAADFESLQLSPLTTFRHMLGDFDIYTYLGLDASRRWLGVLMFVLFMLSVQVILVNLLIAIISDAYDRVKSVEGFEFLKGLAEIIDVMEVMSPAAASRALAAESRCVA